MQRCTNSEIPIRAFKNTTRTSNLFFNNMREQNFAPCHTKTMLCAVRSSEAARLVQHNTVLEAIVGDAGLEGQERARGELKRDHAVPPRGCCHGEVPAARAHV